MMAVANGQTKCEALMLEAGATMDAQMKHFAEEQLEVHRYWEKQLQRKIEDEEKEVLKEQKRLAKEEAKEAKEAKAAGLNQTTDSFPSSAGGDSAPEAGGGGEEKGAVQQSKSCAVQ